VEASGNDEKEAEEEEGREEGEGGREGGRYSSLVLVSRVLVV
jgi:hypothetical protein